MKTLTTLALTLALLGLTGCKSDNGGEPEGVAVADQPDTTVSKQVAEEPEIITKPSGVRYQDLVVGEGTEALDRMQVECHYTLWFADSTGLEKTRRFQSSKDRGQPFQCQLGVKLIPGWSDGMIGMKEGGTRRIYVPWNLGYGEQGGGPIPPKANLIFEIEFIRAL